MSRRNDTPPAGPLALALMVCLASTARADFAADLTLTNRTGADKADWPVFLSVRQVFGGNLPLKKLNAAGFHVIGPRGREIPSCLRTVPPASSIGNDHLVFLLDELAAGASVKLRITNTGRPGPVADVDVVANANNLLPRLTGPGDDGEAPPGYKVVSNKGVKITCAPRPGRSGRMPMVLTLPAGSSLTLRSVRPVRFKKGCPYAFGLWAETRNVAYNGWGFWGAGVGVKFDPPALRGRSTLTLRGTRTAYLYRFDPGGRDAWGVPETASRAQTDTVPKGRKRVPADLWAQAGGKAYLVLTGRQDPQPFLEGDKTGTVTLGDLYLFEQPTVAVDRPKPLAGAAQAGAVVFARPVNMPRMGAFAHEAVDRLEAFAMPGERRQVRLGLYAAEALRTVEVRLSALTGEAGELPADRLELESLGPYVEPYRPIAELPAGRWAEWLLAFDVPRDARPGSYAGAVRIAAGGKPLRRLPVRLQVLPTAVPDMKGYWVGGIYNVGMGLDRNDAFYRCYGKARFNYLMLFDYLAAGMKGPQIDLAAADRQIDKIATLAKVTGGVGLYREPNMSEDQPRKFYQIAAGEPDWEGKYERGTDAKFKTGYQKLIKQIDAHARRAGWPTLVYMVSDEPSDRRDVHPSMGWLNEAVPDAVTCADAQFKDLLRTWQWYNLPILDDPVDWTGPAVYEYVRARKKRFGLCGTGWPLAVARYQPGLMLASTGACYWHFWHTKGPFERRGDRVVRTHAVAAMSAGFNDLRYYVALRQRIAAARAKGGAQAGIAAQAEKFLAGTLALAPGDHDRHLMPHNGVPADWGDDRFYDRWRATMKDYLLRLER